MKSIKEKLTVVMNTKHMPRKMIEKGNENCKFLWQ